MSNSKNTNSSIGFLGVLFLIFLTLKLAEVGVVATWSWWWVTSPIWTPVGLFIVGILIYIASLYIFAFIKGRKSVSQQALDEIKKQEGYIPKKSKFQERLEAMTEERKNKPKNYRDN